METPTAYRATLYFSSFVPYMFKFMRGRPILKLAHFYVATHVLMPEILLDTETFLIF